MKTLHLIRHAKSSWKNPKLSDHQRPLKKRGIKDCRLMASVIAEAGCSFAPLFSSDAERAVQTIEEVARALDTPPEEWTLDPELYTFDPLDLVGWLHWLSDEFDEVTLVGHNPALTELARALASNAPEHLPTCGYLQLKLPTEHWRELGAGRGEVVAFVTPRMLKEALKS